MADGAPAVSRGGWWSGQHARRITRDQSGPLRRAPAAGPASAPTQRPWPSPCSRPTWAAPGLARSFALG